MHLLLPEYQIETASAYNIFGNEKAILDLTEKKH
jgi:hypothetical protein